MITKPTDWVAAIQAPSREVQAMVIIKDINQVDDLKSIKVEKIPTNGSFFGYSICQKATIELFDKYDDKNYEKGTEIKVYLGVLNSLIAPCKCFYIDEVVRDEVNKKVTITAYDLLYNATKIQQKELNIVLPLTLKAYAEAVATHLGTTIKWDLVPAYNQAAQPEYTGETPPNFDGTETLREVLEAVAGATASICFINYSNEIVFKHLTAQSIYSITADNFFSLSTGTPVKLSQVSHITELGENYIAGENGGYNQIIRNNPFLENREDITDILNVLLTCWVGKSITPYTVKWRGNPQLEIGDTVTIDGNTIYYLGETITYTGGMSATSEWKEGTPETVDGTPATLGAALAKTFAKVDKVANKIELVAAEATINAEAISELQLDTSGIKASVSTVQNNLDNAISGVNGDIQNLHKKVELAMTDEQVQIKIDKAFDTGVKNVTTSTGFTFNDEGLTVSKTGSEMTTQITEDGMTVYKDNLEVLVADNTGVKARNLHAETYLIIGNNSRFEDYTSDRGSRTGCFWIGG